MYAFALPRLRKAARQSVSSPLAVTASAATLVTLVLAGGAGSPAPGPAPAAVSAPAPSTAASAERTSKAAVAPVAQALPPAPAPVLPPPPPAYANNLDGWIRRALEILRTKRIPGSYQGIHRNIWRESTGNPRAINLWDSNAAAGIPSKGLLQVIDPTFRAYHVEGTSWDIWDPVANIAAACNYAAHRYGSMDNVSSAY